MHKSLDNLRLTALIIACLSVLLVAACNNGKSDSESPDSKPATGLNPVVEEVYSSALETMKSDFQKHFFWRTPATIASEALRVHQTRTSYALRADFNGFMDWLKKSDDAFGQDVAALSTPPFALYEPKTEDKLTLAKLRFAAGGDDEIVRLFWGGDAIEGGITPDMYEAAEADARAIYILGKIRFMAAQDYLNEIAKFALEAGELEDGVGFAVVVKNTIELAKMGASFEELDAEIMRVSKNDAEIDAILCLVLRYSGRLKEAEDLMSGYLGRFKDDAPVWAARAAVFVEMGQAVKAREYVTKALEINGQIGEVWVLLATSFSYEGRFEEAVDYFEQAFAMDPFQPLLYPPWATMLMDMGRIKESRDRLDSAIEYFPSFPEIRIVSGRVYAREGELESALSEYETAARLAPSVPYSFLEMGKIQIELGDTDAANLNFDKAKSLGMSETRVEAEWGRALLAANEHAKALIHLEKAAEGTKDDGGLFKDMAKAYRELGKLADAAASFDKAVSINTYDGESAVESALCYAQLGQIDKGLSMLDKAVFAGWIDTDYIVRNFPQEIQQRKEFENILGNMNPQFGR